MTLAGADVFIGSPPSLPSSDGLPVNNVLNFGAKGDGITDDSAAITSALAAGGITFFPANYTFALKNVTIPNGAQLWGGGYHGIGSPLPPAGYVAHLLRIDGGGANNHMFIVPTNGGHNYLFNLFLDGNIVVDSAGDLIHCNDNGSITGGQVIVNHCTLESTPGIGIYFGTWWVDCHVLDTSIYGCGDRGVVFAQHATDGWMIGTDIAHSQGNNVEVGGSFTRIIGCDMWGSITASDLVIGTVGGVNAAPTQVLVHSTEVGSGAAVDEAVVAGTATGIVFASCQFHAGSMSTDNTYAQIKHSSTGAVTITGCTFGGTGGNLPATCINVSSTGTITLTDNTQLAGAVSASVTGSGYLTLAAGATETGVPLQLTSPTLSVASGTSAGTTTLSVNALPYSMNTGSTLQLLSYPASGGGAPTAQTITLNGAAAQGATSITVSSFTPTISFPIGTELCPLAVVLPWTRYFPNATALRINVVGAGGGGGGAGLPTGGTATAGGGGGAGGAWNRARVPLSGTTTLTFGFARGAQGGANGTSGNNGSSGNTSGTGSAGATNGPTYCTIGATTIQPGVSGPGGGSTQGSTTAAAGGVTGINRGSTNANLAMGGGGVGTIGVSGAGLAASGGPSGGPSTATQAAAASVAPTQANPNGASIGGNIAGNVANDPVAPAMNTGIGGVGGSAGINGSTSGVSTAGSPGASGYLILEQVA
jgi:hypothetical protein